MARVEGDGIPEKPVTIRNALMATALAVLLALAPQGAFAQYTASCGFIVDPPVIQASVDAEVHVVGSGFTPGSTVDFFIDGEFLGTAQASDDPDGNVDATFPLPPGFQTDGQYEITVECPDGAIASNILIVGSGLPTTTEPLPATGSGSTLSLLKVGGSLIALGSLGLLVARKRRSDARAHSHA